MVGRYGATLGGWREGVVPNTSSCLGNDERSGTLYCAMVFNRTEANPPSPGSKHQIQWNSAASGWLTAFIHSVQYTPRSHASITRLSVSVALVVSSVPHSTEAPQPRSTHTTSLMLSLSLTNQPTNHIADTCVWVGLSQSVRLHTVRPVRQKMETKPRIGKSETLGTRPRARYGLWSMA